MLHRHIEHAGPGLWIRIQHRFGPRMTEWMLAAITALWGAVLVNSPALFNQLAWSGFRDIFRDEWTLGWIMVFLGALRIGGLIVNGARKTVTPWIRSVSASLGCCLFVGITYCYWQSGVFSTWLAIYPVFAVVELLNVYRAAHDAGESHAPH